jgi:hypothetical protein
MTIFMSTTSAIRPITDYSKLFFFNALSIFVDLIYRRRPPPCGRSRSARLRQSYRQASQNNTIPPPAGETGEIASS